MITDTKFLGFFKKNLHFYILIFLVLMKFTSEDPINVHVIPHTHDDAGWLFTFDSYYNGSNRFGCVKCILDNMLNSLRNNPERTFTYCEMSFFEEWYRDQSQSVQLEIKKFVADKRIEFLSGGWVMNDEATPHYQHIIDQIRLGMQFLKTEFDIIPKTAWFLDPFGHSLSNAYLMEKLGYENIVIVRIDYRDKEKRIKEREMEFFWKPYNQIDNGKSSIFTHITYGHYNPDSTIFPGLVDPGFMSSSPINESNYKSYLSNIYNHFSQIRDAYRSNEILFLFGDDFSLKSETSYENIETLIKLFKNDSNYSDKINIFYSTPSKYFKKIFQINKQSDYPVYEDKDFLPYADKPREYWTGYFTSRAYLKGLIRDAGNYLKQTNQLLFNFIMRVYENFPDKNQQNSSLQSFDLMKDLLGGYNKKLDVMRREIGIAQHHDGVTGTARNDVSDDYINRLEKGIGSLADIVREVLQKENFYKDKSDKELKICMDTVARKECNDKTFLEGDLDKGIMISVINSGMEKIYPKQLKIMIDENSHKKLTVKEINSKSIEEIEFDLIFDKLLNVYFVYYLIDFNDNSAFKNYIIKLEPSHNDHNIAQTLSKKENVSNYSNNNSFKILFENNETLEIFLGDGKINFQHKTSNEQYSISLTHGYFDYHSNGYSRQGAYLMATDTDQSTLYEVDSENSFIIQGKILTIVNIKYKFSSLIVKIYPKLKSKNYSFDVDSILHKYEPQGQKEFVLIMNSNIDNTNENNKTEFFTDTNAMRVIKRIKDHRDNYKINDKYDQIPRNFYPINSVLYISDKNNKDKRIYIFNDRSQAGTSYNKGEIMFDINRWSDKDDNKGLADGLYEYQSSRSNFVVHHVIAYSRYFSSEDVYNYINKKPLYGIYYQFDIESLTNSISKAGNKGGKKRILSDFLKPNLKNLVNNFTLVPKIKTHNLFQVSNTECFEIDYYFLSNDKVLLQFYNKSDPNLFEFNTCKIKLRQNDIFNFKRINLNGIDLKKKKVKNNAYIKKRFFVSLDFLTSDKIYEEVEVSPQEFETFLIEIK